MIHVIATIELEPGKRDDFLEEFRAIVSTVETEEGCIEYGAAIDLDTGLERQAPLRQDVVEIIEKWESLETLRAHLESRHMASYRERIKNFVKGATLRILEPA